MSTENNNQKTQEVTQKKSSSYQVSTSFGTNQTTYRNQESELQIQQLQQGIEQHKLSYEKFEGQLNSLSLNSETGKMIFQKLSEVNQENIKLNELIKERASDITIRYNSLNQEFYKNEFEKYQSTICVKQTEVDQLRVKLFEQDILNLMQNDKIQELESIIKNLQRALNQREKNYCSSLEIESKNNESFQQGLSFEIDGLNQKLQNSIKSSQQLREKIQQLQGLNYDLEHSNMQKDDQISVLKIQVSALNNEMKAQKNRNAGILADLQKQFSQEKSVLFQQLEEKNSSIMNLQNSVNSQEREIQKLQKQINGLEQQILGLKKQLNNQHEEHEEVIKRHGKRASEMTENHRKEKNKLMEELEEKVRFLQDWQNKHLNLEQDNQRLRAYLDNLLAENDALKKALSDMQRDLANLVQQKAQLDDDLARANSRMQQMQEALEKSQKELGSIKGNNQSQFDEIQSLKDFKSSALSQIEELQAALKLKTRELVELTSKYQQFQSEFTSYKVTVEKQKTDYESQIATLQDELSKLRKQYEENKISFDKIQKENAELEKTLIDYEAKIALLTNEIQRFNNLLKQRLEEIASLEEIKKNLEIELQQLQYNFNDLENKNEFLNVEVDRLSTEYKEMETEVTNWRYKYAQWSSLTQKVQDQNVLMVTGFALVETLTKRLAQKENEVEELRKSSLKQNRR